MSIWTVRVLEGDVKSEYTIKAIGYTADRIKEIFKEIHPEWDITEVVKSDIQKETL